LAKLLFKNLELIKPKIFIHRL